MKLAEKLLSEERETILTYSDSDKKWHIYTAVPAHMRKFDKLGYQCIKTQFYSDNTVESKEYEVPKFAISFRKPEKIKRELSEEQRQAMVERMKAMQEAKHSKV